LAQFDILGGRGASGRAGVRACAGRAVRVGRYSMRAGERDIGVLGGRASGDMRGRAQPL
jgi:hypothetical protein